MIVTTLFGGIGNQMFIYAMARALALRNNKELVIDATNGFTRDFTYNRKFALDTFPIKYTNNRLLSFDFTGGYVVKKLSQKVGRHIFAFNYFIEQEVSNFKFEEKWINEKYDKIILNGYWANEKYFKDFEIQIREDFSFENIEFSSEVKKQEELIKNTLGTPIAVGIRTYNEISDSAVRNNGFFYTKDDFYKRAMYKILEKIPDAVFYVFSQDFEWLKNNLDFDLFNIVIIDEKIAEDRDIGDIYLMTLCSHYIISNSTFYWWGTWLNSNKDKMVIVPDQWTNSVLDCWIKL
jgi:hypothetical protein